MKILPPNTPIIMAGLVSLLLTPMHLSPAQAETFSFRLNDFGLTDLGGGRQSFGGKMVIEGESMDEPQSFEFDLTHGDRGDGQSLEMGLSNQGESILEAVFDLFGLDSPSSGSSKLNAKVSGDINDTESELDIELGENLPGARMRIKMPK